MAKIYFKENLKKLRLDKGDSQASIASLVNKRNTVISSWELGGSEPSFSDIQIISDYFGISVGEMISTDLSNGKDARKSEISKNATKGKDSGKDLGKDVRKIDLNSIANEPQESYLLTHKQPLIPSVVTVDSTGRDNIVHVPVRARAGYLVGYGDREFIGSLQAYTLPGVRAGTFRSFEAEGNSMNPTVKNRDWVIGEWVESLEQIRENRVHVIVTHNDGILIKRVLNRIKDRGKLYLISDTISQRDEYPTIELEPQDISEIWYARIKFGTDFSAPSEIYTSINDLKIEVMEIKKQLLLK